MDLSIVIASFNTKELLSRCIRSIVTSLERSTITHEIIVVDNASTDGTREVLNKDFPRVVKILNKTNVGYGRANNIGIQRAKGTHILLLNSDIEVVGDAIDKIYLFSIHHPNAFVGGKLLNPDGSAQPSCGPAFTLPIVFAMLFLRGDHIGISRYSPDTPQSVDWISGACVCAPKTSFEDVGLFDESIFLYMEEIEFLYRAKHGGFDVHFDPEARFIHIGSASSGSRKTPVVNIYKGLLYFYRKHRSIMEQRALTAMLRIKAIIAIGIGKVIGKPFLVTTYEQALRMV